MTNNNSLTPEQIARLAQSLRTANFDPNRGAGRPRSRKTKRNNR